MGKAACAQALVNKAALNSAVRTRPPRGVIEAKDIKNMLDSLSRSHASVTDQYGEKRTAKG
jgi:hypothetical protein